MNLLTTYNRTLRILNTNEDSYPKATFIEDLNEQLGIRTLDILRLKGYKEINSGYAKTTIYAVSGLSESDTGYNGEYQAPTDTLDIIRIEVDKRAFGESASGFHVINKGDFYTLSGSEYSEEADIESNFKSPAIRIGRKSIFVRPLPTVTVSGGLWIYYQPRQVSLSSDSDTPEFESNLHQILMYDCALLEILSHPENYSDVKRSMITAKVRSLEEDFEDFYRDRLRPDEGIKVIREKFN
jgi:hypothetical protein